MAKQASAESVQADMQGPNFRAAVLKIRTIPAKRDKIASVNGEIADVYAKIEGHKCNRKGAKIFYTLDRMEADERNDVLRTLRGLLDAAGYDAESNEDLADLATARVLPMRRTAKAEGGEEAEVGEAVGDDTIDQMMDEQDEEIGSGLAAEVDGITIADVADVITDVLTDNGVLDPNVIPVSSDDGFTEATDEELKAQKGRGGGNRARKASVSEIGSIDNVRSISGK